MKHLFVIILISFCFVVNINAQQDEQMTVFMYNPLYFNPAYAGSKDAIRMVAIGRFQWVNFDGAPKTQWFSIHAPLLSKSIGIGAHIVHDQIGKRERTAVFGDVSTSIKVSRDNKNRLAFGLSFGADIMSLNFTNTTVNSASDPFYGMNVSTTKFNMGAGIYYYGKNYYMGISTPRLLEPSIKANNDIIQKLNVRHYFLMGGYVFDLNSVFKLKTAALIKYTPHTPFTADIDASLLSYDRLWTGLMYRFNESVGVHIGIILKDFTIGYAYDFPINKLRTYQSGSHEVFIQYDLKTKKTHFTSSRYF